MNRKQHRGVVTANHGILAASQPLAVSAGLAVLQRGGNFADAAIAVSAVLCVVEPYNSQIGGDAFLIVYDAAAHQTTALNGSGAAPRQASADKFPDGIPVRGLAFASVPGLVAVWADLHKKWGSIPMADLLKTAISYAEDGYPAGHFCSGAFARHKDLFEEYPQTLQQLANGKLPAPGTSIRQHDLAWTLRQIAENGRDAFYDGAITDRMVEFSEKSGGLFSREDFANHTTQISDPIKTNYRGYTIHGQPPVSQGHILLQSLNLVEGFDLKSTGHNTYETIHLQVEAKRLAFADRAAYLGDPAHIEIPMDTLLSKSYADDRRSQIDTIRATPRIESGQIDHDTTYFCIIDSEGNAVSFIQSVFWGFGCGVAVPNTGVLFNNRMCGFSLDPKSPNFLVPGRRTAHTLNAYIITHEKSGSEELAWVGGTPGGDVQVQSSLQVISNLIDFGMNPQEAVEAPRWQHSGDSSDGTGTLEIEDRVDPVVRDELSNLGHHVETMGGWAHGSAYQLIAVDPETGAYMAGSDPRCDGHAAGF